MTETTLAEYKKGTIAAVGDDAFTDSAMFDHMQRVAMLFSESDLAPKQYQKKPGNCFIALCMAKRLGCDPMMFMQNSYVVHGKPGIEAKLAIALANQSGIFKGPIRYRTEGSGNNQKWTAFATVQETGDVIEMSVDWGMVTAEGWDKKEGSKWKTMREVMGRYRAAMLLIRTHCPQVIMGLPSTEELRDIDDGCNDRPRKAGVRRAEPLRLSNVVEAAEGAEPPGDEDGDDTQENPPFDLDATFAGLTTAAHIDNMAGDLKADPNVDMTEAEIDAAAHRARERIKVKQ
jgi:hypothetical protein